MGNIRLAWKLWQQLGPVWLAYRLWYAARMKIGLLRRHMPAYTWAERPLAWWLREDIPANPTDYLMWRRSYAGRFFFDTIPTLPSGAPWNPHSTVAEADALLEGHWRYFMCTIYEIGFPPDWHFNPMTGRQMPAQRHWTQIDEGSSGDIKLVWEPSRFAVAYLLVRAYAASGDERYPAAFWHLVEDWATHNTPQRGANWRCGQEVAFRLMAWCFGLYGFAGSPHTTAQRVANLAAMIAAHADRIEKNTEFARSQKNNHIISEAVGLWTVGLLFPEFKQSRHWLRLGRRALTKEASRQIYDDGAYIQHSVNYHRVMLHDYLWALRLGELNQTPLPSEVYRRFEAAVSFLSKLIAPISGQASNYGPNDGALILPLNTCDYTDYRPVTQASHYLTWRERLHPIGPWDEDLFWLFGPDALDAPYSQTEPTTPSELVADTGGYYTVQGDHSWAMVRCAHYKDRPNEADQLHVSLWWRGINVVCDAGTYLYSAPPPWHNGLATAAVHNTVTVDGQDQMTRTGRFLWLDWAQGRVRHRLQAPGGQIKYWEGEHSGYQRLAPPATHRRGIILLGGDDWVVLDWLQSDGEHNYTLHWLMPKLPYIWEPDNCAVTLQSPTGVYQLRASSVFGPGTPSMTIAAETSVRGWRSLYYADKIPALSVALTKHGSTVCFCTLFAPPEATLQFVNDSELCFHRSDQDASIRLGLASTTALVTNIRLTGAAHDYLEIRA